MIVWTGWGILVPLIAIGVGAIVQSQLRDMIGNSVSASIGYALGGVIIWFLGKKLNNGKSRVLVDKQSGEEITLKPKHTFFFIPVQYWAYIIWALSVVSLFIPEVPSY